MISIMSIRSIHGVHANNDEIILFGSKSIIQLMNKVNNLNPKLVDKVLQMFMVMKGKRSREEMSNGLAGVLGEGGKHSGLLLNQTLHIIKNLNKLKRGVADKELDSDNIILTIKQFIQPQTTEFTSIDLSAIAYCILNLVADDEYSVREYAEHALTYLLEKAKGINKEE